MAESNNPTHKHVHNHSDQLCKPQDAPDSITGDRQTNTVKLSASDDHLYKQLEPTNLSKTSGVVLAIALCTHNIFEGIALGIQKDLEATGFLFLSIGLHNFIASVSLGGNFVSAGFTFWKSFCLMFSFAVSSSIGVAIGLGLSD